MSLLTRDFNEAASQLNEQMALLRASKPAKSFIDMYAYPWWSSWNSCYNFAINRPSIYHIHTGDITRNKKPSAWSDFSKFATQTQENAVADGLRNLGDNLSLVAEGETPAALFFLDKKDGRFLCGNDYHWFALRHLDGDIVWAHKPGSNKPEICEDGNIFSAAMNYKTFGGYFAVPNDGLEEKPNPIMSLLGKVLRLEM